MIDLYIGTLDYEDMYDALASVTILPAPGLTFEGEFVTASPRHALHYLGAVVGVPGTYDEEGNELTPTTFLPGVYAALRCYDAELAEAVRGCEVEIVDRPPNVGTWA